MPLIRLDEPRVKPRTPPTGWAPFALGFRPFYLLAAALAVLFVPAWIGIFAGHAALSPVLPPLLWHGHEMVFGFACAVIVGFLFTAVRNWTGLDTPSGWPLAALAALWLAARVALLTGPHWLAALLDLAFLPVAAVPLAQLLFKARQSRNYFLLLILGLLTAANLLVHAGSAGWWAVSPITGLHLAVALITVLETVIAGRIVPSFTANALKCTPYRHLALEWAAVLLTAASLLAWALAAPAEWLSPLALLAAVAQAVRCWGWRPFGTWRKPLLWILHLSHGWIIVALALLGLAGLGVGTAAPVLHLLTVGGMAGLILGMITRTALGHTGRMLVGGRVELACYMLLQLALAARVLPVLVWPETYRAGLMVSATAWALCFALYLWKYTPMLLRVRPDGREG